MLECLRCDVITDVNDVMPMFIVANGYNSRHCARIDVVHGIYAGIHNIILLILQGKGGNSMDHGQHKSNNEGKCAVINGGMVIDQRAVVWVCKERQFCCM